MNFHLIRLCTVSTFPVHLLSPTSGMLLRRVTSAGGIYLSTKTLYKFVRVEKESVYCIALGGFMWGISSTVDVWGRYPCHGSTPCAPLCLLVYMVIRLCGVILERTGEENGSIPLQAITLPVVSLA